jgi:hypothetical protein
VYIPNIPRNPMSKASVEIMRATRDEPLLDNTRRTPRYIATELRAPRRNAIGAEK